MGIRYRLFTGLLLFLLLLAPAAPAYAREAPGATRDGKVIFGEDYVLKDGETLDGDLVVFGGNVSLESGSVVSGSVAVIGGNVIAEKAASIQGDVVLVGGNLELDAQVSGDLAMIGGRGSLGDDSRVDGNINTVGGQLQQAAGAQVGGTITHNPQGPIVLPEKPQLPTAPLIPRPNMDIRFNPFAGLAGVLGRAILVALVAVIASLFLQPQMERVSTAITSQPVLAGGFGAAATAAALLALIIMLVTIILIPVSGLGMAALALSWLFGLSAIGYEVGQRFAREIHQSWTMPVATGVGTLMLMLVVGLIGLIPCVGWVFPMLIGVTGIGGVVLTYFGTRNYPQPMLPPVELPPAS